MWPDVKVATLKDTQGAVTGHRYEARMFGVGMHQHQSAYIITSALAFDAAFASQVDELLERYDLVDFSSVLTAYDNARNHNGAFFYVAYGNGKMADFARDFADLLEPIVEEAGLIDEAQPLLRICRSGCSDAKVNRFLFPTLKDVQAFQKSYDSSIFDDSNQCAAMVFERDIERESERTGVSATCA